MLKKKILARFSIGYCELLIETPLETAISQNQARAKIKQVPEKIIENSFCKLERTFINSIKIEQNILQNPEKIYNEVQNFLTKPVFIQKESEVDRAIFTESFSKMVDNFCREKIGILNKEVILKLDEEKKRNKNKKISIFKKHYQDLTKYIFSNITNNDRIDEVSNNIKDIFKESNIDFKSFIQILYQIINEDVFLTHEIIARKLSEYFFDICLKIK